MFGVPVKAHAEEVQDLSANGDESTIKWYIAQDTVDEIFAGMICPSCLEPFPATLDNKNLKIWRDHADTYSKLRTVNELLDLVKNKRCPVCQYEATPEMAHATFKGQDPFEPEKIEVPDE